MFPVHVPSPHEVYVQVGHQLSRVRPAVDGQTVAAFKNALLLGQLIGYPDHLADQRRVRVGHIRQRPNVLYRDDEYVNRCQWIDIGESEYFLIAVKNPGRYLPARNLAEDAVRLALFRARLNHLLSMRGVWKPGNPSSQDPLP